MLLYQVILYYASVFAFFYNFMNHLIRTLTCKIYNFF